MSEPIIQVPSDEENKSNKGESPETQCRICYDDSNTSSLISPCMCKGDNKFVHRECLDDYRVMNEGMLAFSQCNTCSFHYLFKAKGSKTCQSPECILRCRVTRDILFTIIIWLSIILLFSLIFHYGTYFSWELSIMYGCLILFAMIGFFAMIYAIMYSLCYNGPHANIYCWGCYFVPPGHCNCPNTGGGNSNEGGVIILLIVLAIFAIIGLIYATIFTFAVLSVKMSKHYQKYHKMLMTQEYIVMDLQKLSDKKIAKLQTKQITNKHGMSVVNYEVYGVNKKVSVSMSKSNKKGSNYVVLKDEHDDGEIDVVDNNDVVIEIPSAPVDDDIIKDKETVRYE